LANFISEPVLKGFIVGLALTIIIGQVPKLFGVGKGSGDFFQQLWHVIGELDKTSVATLVVGLASLAIVLGLKRWLPLIPGSLVAVLLAILAVSVFHLDDHGVKIVGHIDSGLPRLGLPHVPGASTYLHVAGPAIGVLLVGFAEGLGAAKTYAIKHGYEVNANRELSGLGGANLGAGLASGMVVNGSLSKTAVNGGAGAKSQVSGLVVAALTIVTLLFLTGLFEKLPEATLAAVVIAAVIELVDIAALRRLYGVFTRQLGTIYGHAARADFAAAIAALLGVLIFDTLPGLVIGIGVSLLLLLYRSARPNVATLGRIGPTWVDRARHPDAATTPGVVVLRVESGLFFANADHVRAAVRVAAAKSGVRAVVLDGETMPFIDVTAAEMFGQLANTLRGNGVELILARDVGQVRDVLRRAGPGEALRRYPSVAAAVDAAVDASDAGDEGASGDSDDSGDGGAPARST
jgi:anti-anti-sigma factor